MRNQEPSLTDTVVCEACGLTQFVQVRLLHTAVPRCRRCRRAVGVLYMDTPLPGNADPEELRQLIGALIRNMRQRRGWSQAQLARAAATAGRSGINRIERGHVLPSLRSLVSILAAVGTGRIIFRLDRPAVAGPRPGRRIAASRAC